MKRKAIIVLGMHRSGTSAVSGILQMHGLDLGKAVMGGNIANPKGFFENYRIMSFNEDLFRILHVNWHNTLCLHEGWWTMEKIHKERERLKTLIFDEFNFIDPLLFKDPRICVLLPIYLEVFKDIEIEPFFVLTYRNPYEVAQSLNKRDAFSFGKSFRIWIDHMLKAEKYSRKYPRLFIDYNEIIKDPLASLEKIAIAFSLDLPILPEVSKQILRFIEPALNHSRMNYEIEPQIRGLFNSKILDFFRHINGREITEKEQNELDNNSEEFYSTFESKELPKITLIIVVRNGPVHLEKTIISVISQDYPNLEYIIVNGNTERETYAIIEKYKYLLSHILNGPDHDEAYAMKESMALASGEWISFLNAGDAFVHNESLLELLKLFPTACNLIIDENITHSKSFILRQNVIKLNI